MDKALIFIAMAGYMSIIIGIGFYYYKRSNESSDNFFLGGRSLGPWVAAIQCGSFGHERLALDGASGCGLLVRFIRCILDSHRFGGWDSVELDHRLETFAALFRISAGNHAAGILQ